MSLSLSTTLLLARSRTDADRSRIRLATAAFAFSGALLIDAIHISLIGSGELSAEYSTYISESGLRPGLIAILVILALLAASLAVQGLRIGTVARERRLAALQLAGATQAQLRRLSTADAALLGLSGGLLSAPLYVVLTGLLALFPPLIRVFPGLSASDLVIWVGVAGVLALSGLTIGRLTYRDPTTNTLTSALPWPMRVISGSALVLIGLVAAATYNFFAVPLTVAGLALLWVTLAPRRIRARGRLLGRSSDAVQLLAGARLVADARSAGRLGAMLLGCAFLIGLVSQMSLLMLTEAYRYDLAFYLSGMVMSAFGLVLIAAIAVAALTVGVADQLVDQRRQLACLTALGVDVPFLSRVVRDQISTVATPALMLGSCLGLLIGPGGPASYLVEPLPLPYLVVGLCTLLLMSWGISIGGAALASYLLRTQLRDALDPENLRAA